MTLASWALLLLGSVLMIALGAIAYLLESRRGSDLEGFWTAHRSLSGWSLGMSLCASMLSVSWSLVYGVELFYRYGWGGAWLLGIPWLLVLALFFLLAPRFRSFGAFSQGELFGKVYGPQIQALTVFVLSLVFLTWCGAEIAAGAQVLAPTLKLPAPWLMVGIALVVASYSWAGGFRAVVLTDVTQFLLILGFFLYLGKKTLVYPATFAPLSSAPKPSLALILTSLAVYITGWLAEADIWLRLTAAKDHRHARLAMGFALVVSLFLVLLFPAWLGAVARKLFPEPAQQPALAALLGEVLSGRSHLLVVGGLLGVAASTVSTTANVVAVTWARDWPWLHTQRTNTLAGGRWVSALAVLAALPIALAARSLTELFYLSGGLLSAALFWPTLGLFRPCWHKAATAAALVGLPVLMLTFLLEKTGLLLFSADPGLVALGVGYIPPALAAGGIVFAGVLLLGKILR